jgi:serine phosphatase RsbU (regulator of sigma subunit)/anti-sigma regulatory factor (Ser/Thr protein kinase)
MRAAHFPERSLRKAPGSTDVERVDPGDVEAVAGIARRPSLLTLPDSARREVLEAATRELASRALPALVTHLVLLVLAGVASGMARRHPGASAACLAVAAGLGLARVRLARRPVPSAAWWRRFAYLTIGMATHWGAIVFLVTHENGLHATALIYWMVGAGIAAGGAASLKPALTLAVAFSFTLLWPMALACALQPAGGLALVGIVATFFLFLLALARETSQAFWDARVNAALMRSRTTELEQFQEDTNRDHAIAERVFRNILDRSTFDLASLRVRCSPVQRFNGDLAMVLPVSSHRLRFFLGDFTGHGLGAAVGAMPVADIFFATTRRGLPLETTLREMNGKLRRAMPRGIFLSALAGELDTTSGRLVYWNGGLPEGYLLGPDRAVRHRLRSSRVPIGILGEENFDAALDVLNLQRADRLFICTDGVVEAAAPSGELFGHGRLEQALAPDPQSGFWSPALDDALNLHRGSNVLQDDTTYLELRYDDQLVSEVERRGATAGERVWRSDACDLQFDAPRLQSEDPLAEARAFVEAHICSEREASIANNVVAELFLNALDHGLLHLPSSMKDGPGGLTAYFGTREQRLRALEDGRVTVHLSVNEANEGCWLSVRVADTGAGFRPPDAAGGLVDGSVKHGRGIALVKHFCRKATWLDGGRVAEAELAISARRQRR